MTGLSLGLGTKLNDIAIHFTTNRVGPANCPLIAMCGLLPVGKGFFDGYAELVGAAMCPACLCGAVILPLAIMLSADRVPIKSTQSRSCNG